MCPPPCGLVGGAEEEVSGSVYNSTQSLERKSSWIGRSVDDISVLLVVVVVVSVCY